MLNCYCHEHLIVYAFCGNNITADAQYATFTDKSRCAKHQIQNQIIILTNPVLINDTTGFYSCLQFEKPDFKNSC
jgi:hypothetical protein